MSHGLFGPTEIRILLALGNAALLAHPYAELAHRSFLLFDVGGAVALAGMALMAVLAAVRHTAALDREEPLP